MSVDVNTCSLYEIDNEKINYFNKYNRPVIYYDWYYLDSYNKYRKCHENYDKRLDIVNSKCRIEGREGVTVIGKGRKNVFVLMVIR